MIVRRRKTQNLVKSLVFVLKKRLWESAASKWQYIASICAQLTAPHLPGAFCSSYRAEKRALICRCLRGWAFIVLLRARRQFNNAALRKSGAFLRLHPFVVLLVNFLGDSNTEKNCPGGKFNKRERRQQFTACAWFVPHAVLGFLGQNTYTQLSWVESDVKSHAHLVKNYANKTHLSPSSRQFATRHTTIPYLCITLMCF